MSIDPAILRAMVAAGASTEVILAAVEASHAQEQEKLAEKRAKDAERQRKSRVSRGLSRDVTVTTRDNCDPPGSPPKDPTPQNTPPITPRSDASASVAANASTPTLSASDVIWQKMPRIFADLSGKPESAVRTWIGKVLKQHPPEVALAAFEAAAMARTGDPFGYATRALQNPQASRMNGHGPPAKPRSNADINAEIAMEADRELREKRDDIDSPFAGDVVPFTARVSEPGTGHLGAPLFERLGADRGSLSPQGPSRFSRAFGG